MYHDERWRLARKGEFLRVRADLIQAVRRFFVAYDFLEVETPIRLLEIAPESSIEAVSSEDRYLQTSPELCMKRLLAAGYGRIFQVSKCFRRKERGNLHLPEFTMLEWYEEGADYKTLMERCEDLLLFVTCELGRDAMLDIGEGRQLCLQKPWERITLDEAFDRYSSLSLYEALRRDCFDEILAIDIEPNLGITRPTFLYDYPVELGSLARRSPADSKTAERFELYLNGMELANAFSELTDVDEQRCRFEEEQKRRADRGLEVYPEPRKFLSALNHLPESAGIALGLDRLVMLFCGTRTIDDVVAFTPELL